MINLSNRLLLTTSPPPSIEYITGSVKTGDIVITNTGSATSADYNYSAPSWTLLGKIWGGYWAGGSLPQYRNWAGLHAKIIVIGVSKMADLFGLLVELWVLSLESFEYHL